MHLRPHSLKIALICPQIAPNTGNIARLCVATGTELHLVRPMGFILSDQKLRRSAMDYWPRLKLVVHDDLSAFLHHSQTARKWILENGGRQSIWQAGFQDGDYLLFGSETTGTPTWLCEQMPDRLISIPQAPNERCLNLSTAAGIALFAALAKLQA